MAEQASDAEKALKEHGGTKYKLPNWEEEIKAVEKEVYLENILNNTPAEHEKAARALLEYKRKQGSESREGEGTLDRQEQRIIKGYEDNREATSKSFEIGNNQFSVQLAEKSFNTFKITEKDINQ